MIAAGKSNPINDINAIVKYKQANIYLPGLLSPKGNTAAWEFDHISPDIVPATNILIVKDTNSQ